MMALCSLCWVARALMGSSLNIRPQNREFRSMVEPPVAVVAGAVGRRHAGCGSRLCHDRKTMSVVNQMLRDLDRLLTSMSPEEQQRAAELLEAVRRILSAAPGDAGA